MNALPSGLPEAVSDDEVVSRFLVQSNQFNAIGAKPAAFLPNPKHRNTSIFRVGNEPERLRGIWNVTAAPGRTLKAAAFVEVGLIRFLRLDVIAEEPPDAHANIVGWPWIESDPDLQKARQLELAVQIAGASEVVRL